MSDGVNGKMVGQQHDKRLADKHMALLLAAMAALMPFSIDAYLPAVKAMAQGLSVGEAVVQANLGFFLLGQFVGVLVGGAWSDWRGRKTVALTGLAVYCVASLGLVLLQSVAQLWAWRWVQACGAGMVAVTGGAIVRDHYEGRAAAQMFALIGIIMMAAPLCAPVVGWLMMQIGGWRAVFGFLLVYAAVVCVLQWRFLPNKSPQAAPQGSVWRVVARRYARVFARREALGFLFFQAASFSSMFVFLTESPSLYMGLYGMSEGAYTALFALNIITMMMFNRITAWRLRRGSEPARILLAGLWVQGLANGAMVLLVWWQPMPALAVLVPLVMLSVGTQGLVSANAQACFMAYFQEEGGSANGVLLSALVLVAAWAGFVTTRLHDGSAGVMPMMMLCCTVCGALLLFALSRRALRKAT